MPPNFGPGGNAADMDANRRFTVFALVALCAALYHGGRVACAQTPYSHGDPTPDEQYVLELVNRARANPAAEGDRLAQAGVTDPEAIRINGAFPGSLAQVQADFRSYPARPPIGFNAALMTAAHVHNQDMTDTNNYSHTGSDGSSADQRTTAAGYPSLLVGENLDATIRALYGVHYKLMTDFSAPGAFHRHNLMNDNTWFVYREAGIAIGDFSHRNGTYLGAYVTEDFGNAGTALAVGVAYRDSDSDGFYSVGEGLPGVVVTSPASRSFTVTSASGGYSLPLDLLPEYTAGPRSVDLVFADLNGVVISRQTVALSGSTQGGGAGRGYDNVKADLVYGADGHLLSLGAPASEVVSVVLVHPPAGVGAKGVFKVSRTGDLSGGDLVVRYKVKGGAVAGQDYAALAGSVLIPAGSASAKVNVRSLAGVAPGGAVTLKLKGGEGYGLGAPASAIMPLPVAMP